jgi:hypothetical protein
MLPSLEKSSEEGKLSSAELGFVYFDLGDEDRALRLMKSATDNHQLDGGYEKIDAAFDRMRSDRQFAERLRRAGVEL